MAVAVPPADVAIVPLPSMEETEHKRASYAPGHELGVGGAGLASEPCILPASNCCAGGRVFLSL